MTQTYSTVEEAVRARLAASLGGRRGMLEAATPTIVFSVVWLTTKNLTWGLAGSLALAVVLLIVRLVQRSTTEYVRTAIIGIAIGWLFVWLAARRGGDANDQALAFFLPGILYSSVTSSLSVLSCLVRWPALGFTLSLLEEDDPFAWRNDPQVVTLLSRLTYALTAPTLIGVLLQGPVWWAGSHGWIPVTQAVAVLAFLRLGLGWALRIGAWSVAIWLLARNRTPIAEPGRADR